ncbi:MAG: glutathione synthase [Desulfobacterales bacterium]|nr:glutathione synthase [Desulfobacterales bacterium]
MVLSFHTCFEADQNIICAGREPNADDLEAIRKADAVILPQGCRQDLYEMARENCEHVFPNYDARYKYPWKIGQAHLFEEMGVPHPRTIPFSSVDAPQTESGRTSLKIPFDLPFVFKFDWGGEGEGVFLVPTEIKFRKMLAVARQFEASGHRGFIIQEYIPCSNKNLRVTIVGDQFFSYWRVVDSKDDIFTANLRTGARIDRDSEPDFQKAAIESVKDFCKKTGINLAGFDFIFSEDDPKKTPLFLEINYFFGRKGLGGSEKYYEILVEEIYKWLAARQ